MQTPSPQARALHEAADRFVFHRSVEGEYRVAVAGRGATFVDDAGTTYLDGASGSFVCCLGHGVKSIANAIAEQAAKIAYANTRNFTSEPELRLAQRLAHLSPMPDTRTWLCSSGTAANEAAMKMAYQYHVIRGKPEKTEMISRRRSYHGSSLNALSLTDDLHRRQMFERLIRQRAHVDPPYCFRCPWGQKPAACNLECASAMEARIKEVGPDRVAAVITEVYSGGPLGALQIPDGYLQRVRELCDRYDLLLIVDEIVSGIGRTGTWFATSQTGVVPDMITLGKGLAAGFSPIGAVLVRDVVYNEFASRKKSFIHYETFTGHALSAFAAGAVIDYVDQHDLIARVASTGRKLGDRLQALRSLPLVGDIRGGGFLWGIELVRGNAGNEPFPSDRRFSDRVVDEALLRGLLLMAGRGGVDGELGDTILLVPPYTTSDTELEQMVGIIEEALRVVSAAVVAE